MRSCVGTISISHKKLVPNPFPAAPHAQLSAITLYPSG